MRTEFGIERTIAGGAYEQINCKYIPGYLIPADLERIAKSMGFEDVKTWAMQYLLASPGATVARRLPSGRMHEFQIRTLVPARNPHEHCIHYENGLCKIHEVAPFGCAFFDTTISMQESNRRSSMGLQEIMKDWEAKGLYSQVWLMLDAAGKRAKSARECRDQIDKAYARLKRKENNR